MLLANDLVDRIHTTPTKVVLFVTGGGLEIFPMLTHRGGGSATVLSGMIPYAEQESYDLLGGVPDKLVSEETTRAMAMVAFQRALKLSKGEYPVIGVACSAVLQKTPYEREGRKHFAFVALQTDSQTISYVLDLHEGVSEPDLKNFHKYPTVVSRLIAETAGLNLRTTEETITANLILNVIAEGCGITERTSLGYEAEEDVTHRESTITGISLTKILNGTPLPVEVYDGGNMKVEARTWAEKADWSTRVLFPGSFHPVHPGHWEIAGIACEKLSKDIEFEISITNVQKPTLDLISLEERLQGFTGQGDSHGPVKVWLSNAATFVQKAKQFPDATFIVGYDTALRICDPKYAGDVEIVMTVFEKYGIKFLVFGREQNGVFRSGFHAFPNSFRAIATACSEPRQWAAVSSTEIRRQLSKE